MSSEEAEEEQEEQDEQAGAEGLPGQLISAHPHDKDEYMAA